MPYIEFVIKTQYLPKWLKSYVAVKGGNNFRLWQWKF